MMITDCTLSQSGANETGGSNRTSCPVYGCKRTYTAMAALDDHVKDHENPAQSLPGKIMLCSSPGCNCSFPSMQKLMDHVRRHYKPNIFFLCESCRTKLRSYRGLLTHLHTCSKVQGGKAKATEPVPPPTPAGQNPSVNLVPDQRAPQLDSAPESQETPSQIQNPDTFFPPAPAQTDSASSSVMASTLPSQQGPSPAWVTAEQPAEVDLRPTPDLLPSLSAAGSAVSLDLSYTQDQHNTARSPAAASNSQLGSTVVWNKNQGVACNRGVIWEPTKGRYTCVQCGFMDSSREKMTRHTSGQHSCDVTAEDTGVGPQIRSVV